MLTDPPNTVAPIGGARSELAPAAARRLILLGETLDAEKAEALATFDERVPADQLLVRVAAAVLRRAA